MKFNTNYLGKQSLHIDYNQIRESLRKEKTQSYLMLILSLFTISFFSFFVIKPTLVKITELKHEVDENKKIDERLSKKINQLIAVQSEYEMISSFIPKIKEALPDNPQYIQTLKDLEGLRSINNTNIAAIEVGEVSIKADKPGFFKVSLDASGEFLPIESLISRLLTNRRIIIIPEFSMTQDAKLVGQSNIRFSADMEIPYVSSNSSKINVEVKKTR